MRYKCNPEKYRNLAKDESKYRQFVEEMTRGRPYRQAETTEPADSSHGPGGLKGEFFEGPLLEL